MPLSKFQYQANIQGVTPAVFMFFVKYSSHSLQSQVEASLQATKTHFSALMKS